MIDFTARNWWIPPGAIGARRKQTKRQVAGSQREWGWIKTYVLELSDGTQERVVQIRLPAWGMYYSINCDEERWAQLVFRYYGQRGCCFGAVFDEVGQ